MTTTYTYCAAVCSALGMTPDELIDKVKEIEKNRGADHPERVPGYRTIAGAFKNKKRPLQTNVRQRFVNLLKALFPNLEPQEEWLNLSIQEFCEKLPTPPSRDNDVDFTNLIYGNGLLAKISKSDQLEAAAPYKGFYHLARAHRLEQKIAFELIHITNEFDCGVVCYLVTRKGNVFRGRVLVSQPNLFFTFVRPRQHDLPGMRHIYTNGVGQTSPKYVEGCVLRTADTANKVVPQKCAIKALGAKDYAHFVTERDNGSYNDEDLDHHCTSTLPLFGQIDDKHDKFGSFIERFSQGNFDVGDVDEVQRYWEPGGSWDDPVERKAPATRAAE